MNKKIIILGNVNSGKTSTLKHICSDMVQTTAMDYGNTTINGQKIHFFSSSGHKRFEFMREVLCKNIDGAIILINSKEGISPHDKEIMNFIENKGVPYILFANNQDLNDETGTYRETIYTIPITANGEGINKGLNILLKLIERNESLADSKIACTT